MNLGSDWKTLDLNLTEDDYRLIAKSDIPFATIVPFHAPKQVLKIVVYDPLTTRVGSKFLHARSRAPAPAGAKTLKSLSIADYALWRPIIRSILRRSRRCHLWTSNMTSLARSHRTASPARRRTAGRRSRSASNRRRRRTARERWNRVSLINRGCTGSPKCRSCGIMRDGFFG